MSGARRPVPAAGIVELWHAPLVCLPDTDLSEHYPGEIDRYARLARAKDRLDLRRHRGFLRAVLARYRGEPADALRFSITPLGRPLLDDKGSGLHFSLSRSRTLVAVAVAGEPLGLDIEDTALEFDPLAIAETAFSADALTELRAMPAGACRDRRFVEVWTATEAVLKAGGTGFRAPDESIRAAARAANVRHLSIDGRIAAVALASGAVPQVALSG